MLLWFSDVEKQSSLLEICKQSSGYCYAGIGISPDNIDRTNKKMHSSWLLKIEELALSAECVTIISGLNLSREMGTHFAQESLLKSCIEIATRLHLPLLLHVASEGGSLERTLEILLEVNFISDQTQNNNNNNNNNNSNSNNGNNINSNENNDEKDENQERNTKVILYDALSTCSGDINKIQNLMKYGIYCMISAAGLTDSNEEIKSNYISCLQQIPLQQILPCTDSPWKTPQNLSDTYLRTLRNEPSNMFAVVDAIVVGLSQDKILSKTREEINKLFLDNCLRIFQIPQSEENETKKQSSEGEIVSSLTSQDNNHNNSGRDKKSHDKNIKLNKNDNDDDNNDGGVDDDDDDDDDDDGDSNNKNINSTSLEVNEVNNDTTTTNNNNVKSVPNIIRYNCVKCRKLITTSSDIITHSVGASRSTIFKIGQEGLCSASIFIPYHNQNNQNSQSSNQHNHLEKGKHKGKKSHVSEFENEFYRIENENVHCVGCHAKIGKLSLGEATCACGAIVNGPVLRINATKLDQFFEDTTSLDVSQLSMIVSRLENELIEENDGINDGNKIKSKKKKKTKQRSENRGNFSSYRNKSFVPNASRAASTTMTGGGAEKGGKDESDSRSDLRSDGDDNEGNENEIDLIDNDQNIDDGEDDDDDGEENEDEEEG